MQEVNGWAFPEELEVDEGIFYRMEFGDSVMWDLDWQAHVDLLHQSENELKSIRVDVEDSGVDSDGIKYAVVRTHINMGNMAVEAVGGADETSQQVRDPEHVWSVAESRSLKRAAKKALNIHPVDEPQDPDSQGPKRTDVSRDDTEYEEGHALADVETEDAEDW